MPYGLLTVFGGTGFLGRCIVEHLHTAGARVRVAVRHTTEGVSLQRGDIEVVYADVRDGGTVAQAVKDLSNPLSFTLNQRAAGSIPARPTK